MARRQNANGDGSVWLRRDGRWCGAAYVRTVGNRVERRYVYGRTHKEAAAKSNFHKHEVFAGGVTMFQIAIAIAAISALTKRRKFWIVSLLFGAAGCAFLILAAITR